MSWEGAVVCASAWHELISSFRTIEICRKSRLWRQHLVVRVSSLRLAVRMSVRGWSHVRGPVYGFQVHHHLSIVECCVWLCV